MEAIETRPGIQRTKYRKQRWTCMKRKPIQERVEFPIFRVKSDITRSDRFIELPDLNSRNQGGTTEEVSFSELLRI
jgi:hypothetical protein